MSPAGRANYCCSDSGMEWNKTTFHSPPSRRNTTVDGGRDVLSVALERVVLVEPAGQDADVAPNALLNVLQFASETADSAEHLA